MAGRDVTIGRALSLAAALSILVPATATAQAVSFDSDWEAGITGPGLFEDTRQVAPNRFLRSTVQPRAGKYSAQVTVRPGDNPLRPFCPSCGERSEALGMTRPDGRPLDETVGSGTHFYAFSVRLAPG